MSNSKIENYPFFTILTASLNSVSTIKQTVESIKNQTFQNFEHIVIDGGSNDGTVEVLKKNEHAYNLYWASKPDKGISNALNKGLKLAKGKYVLVLHADDCLLSPGILGYVFNLVKNQKLDIFSFPVLKERPDGGHLLYNLIEFVIRRPVPERFQQWGMQFGLLLIIGFTFIAFYNDFNRIF